jgi:MYXO-CTERM domain-containing protein
MRKFHLSAALAAAAILVPAAALAEPIVGLTASGKLVPFDSANPGAAAAPRAVAGLIAGDKLTTIDFRPATGVLYGLGTSKQLYSIDLTTAQATAVGPAIPAANAVTGTDWAFDFNPAIDRIRFVTSAAQNYVLNPANNAVTANNAFAYAAGDAACTVLVCPTPAVVAVAYTNNRAATPGTALWGIDATQNTLVEVTAANGQFSVVNTRAPLKLNGATYDVTAVAGFDISPNSAVAYLTLNDANNPTTKLYKTELTGANAGVLTDMGVVAGGEAIVDVSAAPVLAEAPLFALYNDSAARTSKLYPLATKSPLGLGVGVAVTGLAAGETLLSIDERPATGALYGISSAGILYTINPATGAAASVGVANGIDISSGVSIDFNPSVDRIRLVTGGGLNYRLHPDTGAIVSADGNLAYDAADGNAGKAPQVLSAAYVPAAFGGPTTLYELDLRSGAGNAFLVTQGTKAGVAPAVSPNLGTLFTVGGLLVPRQDGVNGAGFDIGADGTGYALFSPIPTVRNGVSDPVVARLYSVDLATGGTRLGWTFPAAAVATELPVDLAIDLPVPPPPAPDGGVADGGAVTDGGTVVADAGVDATTGTDGGVVRPDAGTSGDAGSTGDAGTVDGEIDGSDGCSVGAGTGGVTSGALAVLGLALAAVRRRKRA